MIGNDLIGEGSATSAPTRTEPYPAGEQERPLIGAPAREERPPRRGAVRIGLHRRISLFVGVGLALCLVTFGVLGMQAVNEATDRALQERLLIARLAAGQLDYILGNAQRSLELIAGTSQLDPANTPAEVNQRILQTLRAQNDLSVSARRLTLLGPDGTVLATEPADPSLVGESLLSDAAVARAYQTGASTISGLRGDVPDEHVLLITAPLKDAAGQVVGALSSSFDLANPTLLGFLRPVQLGVSGRVRVVDDQGNVQTVVDRTDQARYLVDSTRFAAFVQRGEPYVGLCHECHVGADGTQRRQDVVAFAPLAGAPLGIVLRQSTEEAFATAQNLRWRMVGFGLFLLIAGLLLAQLTTRSVVKPIEALTRTAQRIAKGDLASPVPAVGHSEIAVLADAFDEMRERLQRSLAEIERWNENLEHRVLQRTRELSALLQSANTLTSTLDLDPLLEVIGMRAAETFRGANAGALLLYDRSHDQLTVRWSVGYHSDPLRRLRLRPGEGIAGKVFASGHELLCTNRAEMEQALADLGDANRRHLEQAVADLAPGASCMCAPLVAKNRPIGCLFLLSPNPGAFAESDLRLFRAMADQAAVAVENAQLYEEVRRNEEVRGELLAKLIGAQEEERRRIARELHDETSQALTALVMGLAQLRKVTPSVLPTIHRTIDEIEGLAGLTLDEIHRLIYDLRPTVLDDLGLVPAIQWYIETHAPKAGINIRLQLEEMAQRLPPQVEIVLFRIIQEAVTNIVRHSDATTATVRLQPRDGVVVAVIEDDGKGFDTRSLSRKGGQRGLGILGMKERINLLGGKFSIVSRPGHGVKLSVELPVATRDREHDPSIVS